MGDLVHNTYLARMSLWLRLVVISIFLYVSVAQSAGAVEYTDYISAEGLDPYPNECPGYDTKQSDGEVPLRLELWGMRSTPSLLSLRGPHWLGVVAPDRVLSRDQIELNCILMLNWIAWNRTVLTFKLCTYTKRNCLKKNCFNI